MLKTPQTFDYAIRTLLFLAKRPHADDPALADPVATHVIAEAEGLSPKFLQSVVGKLKKGGLLMATTGPAGGVRLARPSGEITFYDVYRIFESDTGDSDAACGWLAVECGRAGLCHIESVVAAGMSKMYDHFKTVRIVDMLGPEHAAVPRIDEPEWLRGPAKR
jgi:Rrf2 family protein